MEYVGKKEDWYKAGIYKISNSIDDRVYVGSTNNLRDRYRHHRNQLKRGCNPSLLLQRFSSKYGIDTLTFTVIEIVEEERLLEREEYYLNNLNCKLNVMLTALRQSGYKHTEETVAKMRKIAKESFENGRISWNKNKFLFTKEQVQNIRNRIEEGEKQRDLAREFNVTPSTINRLYKKEYNGI